MSLRANCIAVVSVLTLLPAEPAFSQGKRKPERQTAGSSLRVEVTSREGGQPVAEADVSVRDVPERGVVGKKIEMKMKTDANGIAQFPSIAAATILVHVRAKGCKSFSRWYEHSEGSQTILVRLEKLSRWESKPKGPQ